MRVEGFLKNTPKFPIGESQLVLAYLSHRGHHQLNNEDLFASLLLLSPLPLNWGGTTNKIGCGWNKTVFHFPIAGSWDL